MVHRTWTSHAVAEPGCALLHRREHDLLELREAGRGLIRSEVDQIPEANGCIQLFYPLGDIVMQRFQGDAMRVCIETVIA
jgi:hypothetical protein